MPFVEESVLVVERGMTGATGNIYAGLHDYREMALLLHFLRPSDVFVDIGANIGSYTILASRVVGASSFAFEPVPTTYDRLQRNLRANDIQHRVTALRIAVGEKQATVKFSADIDTKNRIIVGGYQGKTIIADCEQLDDLIRDAHPAMWKIDVEGFLYEVLLGAADSLKDPRLAVILLEGESQRNSQLLHQAGFIEVDYDPSHRQISRLSLPSRTFGNHIWVRAIDEVQSRCRDARRINVFGLEI